MLPAVYPSFAVAPVASVNPKIAEMSAASSGAEAKLIVAAEPVVDDLIMRFPWYTEQEP